MPQTLIAPFSHYVEPQSAEQRRRQHAVTRERVVPVAVNRVWNSIVCRLYQPIKSVNSREVGTIFWALLHL